MLTVVPPGLPILSSNIISVPEYPNCLVAVRGERLDFYVTCEASDATRANITVGGKKVQVQTSTSGKFLPFYIVTEEDHMVNVSCSVGNDDSKIHLGTTKTLYVAGSILYTIINKFKLK